MRVEEGEGGGGLPCVQRPRISPAGAPSTSSRDTVGPRVCSPALPEGLLCPARGRTDLGKPRHLSGVLVEPGRWGAMGPTRLCGVRRQVTRVTCGNGVPDVLRNLMELRLRP